MKTIKRPTSGHLKLIISVASILSILFVGWLIKESQQSSDFSSQAPRLSSEKQNRKSSKKAEIEAAERKVALECLLYEDGI